MVSVAINALLNVSVYLPGTVALSATVVTVFAVVCFPPTTHFAAVVNPDLAAPLHCDFTSTTTVEPIAGAET